MIFRALNVASACLFATVLFAVFLASPAYAVGFTITDPGGGECANIGRWNERKNTCTLTTDITAAINIRSDDVTLDCRGHSITNRGSMDPGVYVFEKTGVTVKNCVIEGFPWGVFINYSGGGQSPMAANTVANNVFKNNGYGIYNRNSNGNVFRGNSIVDGDDGIRTDGMGHVLKDNVVSNNSGDGISIDGDFCVLTGNSVKGSEYGIEIYGSGNSLSENTVSNNETGLYMAGDNNSLIGNTFKSNSYSGIYISVSDDNYLYENVSSLNGRYGLLIINSDGNILIGNTFNSNSFYGVQLRFDGLSGPLDGNTLAENTVSHNGIHGIYFSSTNGNTLTENVANRNTGSGIFLDSSSSNELTSNIASFNEAYGFYDTSNSNDYSDNLCRKNDLAGYFAYPGEELCTPQPGVSSPP